MKGDLQAHAELKKKTSSLTVNIENKINGIKNKGQQIDQTVLLDDNEVSPVSKLKFSPRIDPADETELVRMTVKVCSDN